VIAALGNWSSTENRPLARLAQNEKPLVALRWLRSEKAKLGSPAPATGNENPAQGMGFGRRLSGVPKSLGGTLGWGV